MISSEAAKFVEELLDDWESDEWQLDSEFGARPEDAERTRQAIADRRAEWAALVTREL
jgi:hypothetical protein